MPPSVGRPKDISHAFRTQMPSDLIMGNGLTNPNLYGGRSLQGRSLGSISGNAREEMVDPTGFEPVTPTV